ncbi:MAG TPA: threonine/serine exporter family protein [Actinomycetes bacterium]|nr:threonine/serine exporter family protein [Actinomycetes bacterium]
MTEPTPPRWRSALWRGETAPMPIVRTPTRPVYPRRSPREDEKLAAVDEAAQLSLRVGTLLLAGGAPTEDVEAAIFAVGSALGLQTFEVDITYNSIIISIPPQSDRPGITDMRVVRGRSTHYARVAEAHKLVLDIAEGRAEAEDVEPRLREIETLRRPYPRWFVIFAFGVLSAAITVQLDGDALTAAVAFVTASIAGFVGNRMAYRRVSSFFINLVLALFSTLVAVAITAADAHTTVDLKVKSSLVIVGGIISLLPGMSLMVAAQEAIRSFAVTAAARLVELTVSTIGIVVGVLFGLTVANELEITMSVVVRPDNDVGTMRASEFASVVAAAVLAAAVASVAAAVTYQSPKRLAIVGGLMGALGILLFNIADQWIDSPGALTAIPAVAIGIASRLIGVRLHVPTVLVTVPAIVPLLPGLAVYQGLLALTQGDPTKGIGFLVEAASIAIALAAGVLLGQMIGARLAPDAAWVVSLRRSVPTRSPGTRH